MKQIKILEIGEQAISSREPLLVLFNQTATAEIRKVAIIHEELDEAADFELKVGDTVLFGDAPYQIESVGKLANDSLKKMGHTTILFNELSEDGLLPNAIRVRPDNLPKLTEGMIISFKNEG